MRLVAIVMDGAALESYGCGLVLGLQLRLWINWFRRREAMGDAWGTITRSWLVLVTLTFSSLSGLMF